MEFGDIIFCCFKGRTQTVNPGICVFRAEVLFASEWIDCLFIASQESVYWKLPTTL